MEWIYRNTSYYTTLLEDIIDLWKKHCGYVNPSLFVHPDKPVEAVPWDDANEFIKRLNHKEHASGYRLPTSMEWELEARGENNQDYFLIDTNNSDIVFWDEELGRADYTILEDYAWTEVSAEDTSHSVGLKKPNSYGLYDMYGNIGEWVQDYAGEVPGGATLYDYKGPTCGGNASDSWVAFFQCMGGTE